MSEVGGRLEKCFESLREITDFVPEAALVLGSGLGHFGERIDLAASVEYSEIEGFPVSTVPGHAGRFLFGYIGDVPVVCMQGRVHYYEGYPMEQVVLPARLMQRMGAKVLFLTNAAGGLNPEFEPGTLMMITDHISLFVPNPLIGPNPDEIGVRFPDMSQVYDRELQELIRETSKEVNVPIREGVYVQLTGPSYETPVEVRMLHKLGADAAGMSTAVEAVAARHAGMRVCGISCITNPGAGISKKPLSHEEVQETADRVAAQFETLVEAAIRKMGGKL